MQPTKEQEQWLWEQCGWKYDRLECDCPSCSANCWIEPNAKLFYNGTPVHTTEPPIDLNWLFKYAVPKLEGKYELCIDDDSELFGKSVCLRSIANRECSAASPIEYFREWNELVDALWLVISKAFGGVKE